ncbi:flavin reductase family protein [Dokdonia sp. Hel_I_53]|uniref:flavin reductase family protein n=1 Tax=Dokdonia sp. Hel_I_53 TaxID=1566287 RepID=UPI00119B42E3|nr:flavin reductase family protein [Dokdonia sp. Hel_I_53]TVZ52770.1 flavin reductase (DIM6/NTAB) family NADH-FMN oxidoreductase RutF [Dokdonia sp. Hel_I_53]
MLTIDPKEIPVSQLFGHLTGAVGPRPIAFASTVDKDGNVNLAPFSFFNVFGANPPILVYSPSRSGRDNTTKNTLDNVLEVSECTVNIVNYAMVQQMSLASTAYDKGINEFIKSGLTPVASEMVQPPRVSESPVQFECNVIEVKPLGDQGGAGNLVICEVLKIHLSKNILDENGGIDPVKIDQVSRLGGNWYGRAKEGLFEVPKPVARTGIGVDQIPQDIRNSSVLTGNDLGMLGNVENLPSEDAINAFAKANAQLKDVLAHEDNVSRHRIAQAFLAEKNVNKAWMVLLAKR